MKIGLWGVLILLVLIVPSVNAAVCGGTVDCYCGDTLAGEYSMSYDLIDCPGDGLTLVPGTGWDLLCNGHTIDGVGNGTGLNSTLSSNIYSPLIFCSLERKLKNKI